MVSGYGQFQSIIDSSFLVNLPIMHLIIGAEGVYMTGLEPPIVLMVYKLIGVLLYLNWFSFLYDLKNDHMSWLIKSNKIWYFSLFLTFLTLNSLPPITFFFTGIASTVIYYVVIAALAKLFVRASPTPDRQ